MPPVNAERLGVHRASTLKFNKFKPRRDRRSVASACRATHLRHSNQLAVAEVVSDKADLFGCVSLMLAPSRRTPAGLLEHDYKRSNRA